jgi:hypothetical protein
LKPLFSLNSTTCLLYGVPSSVLVVFAFATFCEITSRRSLSAAMPDAAILSELKNAMQKTPFCMSKKR